MIAIVVGTGTEKPETTKYVPTLSTRNCFEVNINNTKHVIFLLDEGCLYYLTNNFLETGHNRFFTLGFKQAKLVSLDSWNIFVTLFTRVFCLTLNLTFELSMLGVTKHSFLRRLKHFIL